LIQEPSIAPIGITERSKGYAGAQSNLGVKCANGEGVPQDYVQAHMWYSLAASRLGDTDRPYAVDGRDRAPGQMNPTELAEAQRLAREWDAAHPREVIS
jgi:TPR repeat protein